MMVSITATHNFIALILIVFASYSSGQSSSSVSGLPSLSSPCFAGDGSLHVVSSTNGITNSHEQASSLVHENHAEQLSSTLSGSFRTISHANSLIDKSQEPGSSHLLSKSKGQRSPSLRLSSLGLSELPPVSISTHSISRSMGYWSSPYSQLNERSQTGWISSHFKSNKYPHSRLDKSPNALKTGTIAPSLSRIKQHSSLTLQPSPSIRYFASTISQTPPLSSILDSHFMSTSLPPRRSSSLVDNKGKLLSSQESNGNDSNKISVTFTSVLQASKSGHDTSLPGMSENSFGSLIFHYPSSSVLSHTNNTESFSLSSSEISLTINSSPSILATSISKLSGQSLLNNPCGHHNGCNSSSISADWPRSSLPSFTASRSPLQNQTTLLPTLSTFMKSNLDTVSQSYSYMLLSSFSHFTKFTSQKREISFLKSSLGTAIASLASDNHFIHQMKTFPPTRIFQTMSAPTMTMKMSSSDVSDISKVLSSSHDSVGQPASALTVLTRTENNIPKLSSETKIFSTHPFSYWSSFVINNNAESFSMIHVPLSSVKLSLLSASNSSPRTVSPSTLSNKISLPVVPALFPSSPKIQSSSILGILSSDTRNSLSSFLLQRTMSDAVSKVLSPSVVPKPTNTFHVPSIKPTPVPSFSDMSDTPFLHKISTPLPHTTITPPVRDKPDLFSTSNLHLGLLTPSPSFSVDKSHLARVFKNSSVISPSNSHDQNHISSSSFSDLYTSSVIPPMQRSSFSKFSVNAADSASSEPSTFTHSHLIPSSRMLTSSQTSLPMTVSSEMPFTVSSYLLQNSIFSRETITSSSPDLKQSSYISLLISSKVSSDSFLTATKEISTLEIPGSSTSFKLFQSQKLTPLFPSTPRTPYSFHTVRLESVTPVKTGMPSLNTIPFTTGPGHSIVSISGHSTLLKMQTISSEQLNLTNSFAVTSQTLQSSAGNTLSSFQSVSPSQSVSEVSSTLFPTKTEHINSISDISTSSCSNFSASPVTETPFSSINFNSTGFYQFPSSPVNPTTSHFSSSCQSHFGKTLLQSDPNLIQTPPHSIQMTTSAFIHSASMPSLLSTFTFHSSLTNPQKMPTSLSRTIFSYPHTVYANVSTSTLLPVSETPHFIEGSVLTSQTFPHFQTTFVQFTPTLMSLLSSTTFSSGNLPSPSLHFPLHASSTMTQSHSHKFTLNVLQTGTHKSVSTLTPSYTSHFVKSEATPSTEQLVISGSPTLVGVSGSYISETDSGSFISKVSEESFVSISNSKTFVSNTFTGSSADKSFSTITLSGSSTASSGSSFLRSSSSFIASESSVAGSESSRAFGNPSISQSSSSFVYSGSLVKSSGSSIIHSGSSGFISGSSTAYFGSSTVRSRSSVTGDEFSIFSIDNSRSPIGHTRYSIIYSGSSRFGSGLSTIDSGSPITPSKSVFRYSESLVATMESSRLTTPIESYMSQTPTQSSHNIWQTSHLTEGVASKHDHFSQISSNTHPSSIFISSNKASQTSSFPFPSSTSVFAIPASHSASSSSNNILPSHSKDASSSFVFVPNYTSSFFIDDATSLTNLVSLSTVAPANTTDAFVSMGTESPSPSLITNHTFLAITSSSSSALPPASNISSITTFSSHSQNFSSKVTPSQPTVIANSVFTTTFPTTHSTPHPMPTTLAPSFKSFSSQVRSTPELPSTTLATRISSRIMEVVVTTISVSTESKSLSPSSHKSPASDIITVRPTNASVGTAEEPLLPTSAAPIQPTNHSMTINTRESATQGNTTTMRITSTTEGAVIEDMTTEEIFMTNGTILSVSPVSPTLDKSFSTMEYWVMMELTVPSETDIRDSDFLSDLETNVAKSYQEARQRELEKENEVKQLLRKLNPEDDIFLRVKRASTVDGSTAQIIDLSRNSEVYTTGELVFYIYSDGTNIPALECATTFTELSLQELTLLMDMVVLSPVTAYNMVPTSPAPPRDTTFIIILSICVPLACLFCCMCCCCSYCVICGPKRARNERTMSPDTFKMLEFKQKFPYKPYTPNQTPRTNMEYPPSDDEEFLSRSNKRVSIGGVWEESSSTARIIPDETSLSSSFRLPEKLPLTNRGLESSVRISEPPVVSYHDYSDQLQAIHSNTDGHLEETAKRHLPAPPSSFLTDPNYVAAQMEISKILEPENVTDVKHPRKKRRKKMTSKTATLEDANNETAATATGSWVQLPNDTQPEPISEARQKVHALIEEAFSLVNFKGTSSTAVTKLPSQVDEESPKEEVRAKPIVDSHVMDLLTGRKKEFGIQTMQPHQESKVVVVPVHTPSPGETSSVLWNPYTARDELQKISPMREPATLPGDVNRSPPHAPYKLNQNSSLSREMERPGYPRAEYASPLFKDSTLNHFRRSHENATGDKWPSENKSIPDDSALTLENGYGNHRDNDSVRPLSDTNHLTDFEKERKERTSDYYDELDVTGVLGRGRPSRSLLDSIKAELMGTGRTIGNGKEVTEF